MVGSLLWYDYETSGLDPVLDRPLQFAGLRTDLGLRPVGPMVSFSGYPGDDVVPAPEAIQVNSIDLLELRRSGLCEAEFCARVLAEFNVPDTCVVGYNSMRFDDEFTRQMCYRNFHDPYAREWSMGNSRWDVVNVLRMARALRPDGMQWPVNAAGVSSSKLTDLTAANGIAHADAHDAAADVLATVELCRQLRSAQPQLYKFLFSQRRKNEVWAQLAPIGKHALVHCDGIYGAAKHNLGIILPLCQHPTNSNAIICYNLAAAAPDALLAADADSIAGNIFARGEARPDGPRRPAAAAYTRLPLTTVYVNRAPALASLITLRPEDQARLSLDLDVCQQRQLQLQRAAGLQHKVQDAYAQVSYEQHADPDQQLYQGGFISDDDRGVMDALLDARPADLPAFGNRFRDKRFPEMLFRYRARNWPDTLAPSEHRRWRTFCEQRHHDGGRLASAQHRLAACVTKNGATPALQALDLWLQQISQPAPVSAMGLSL